jgi:microcystin-dependent protein
MGSAITPTILSLQMPTGAMTDFAGTSAPEGWLMCDGAAISRTAYPILFAALGGVSSPWGAGNGTTTFNVPDFRGRFARYNDNMGTAAGAASRDTGRVHGTAQADTTAVKGLSITNTDLSHSHTFANQVTGIQGYGQNSPIQGNAVTNITTGTTSGVNLNHSHGMSGDAETRPINVSCNRIIKY